MEAYGWHDSRRNFVLREMDVDVAQGDAAGPGPGGRVCVADARHPQTPSLPESPSPLGFGPPRGTCQTVSAAHFCSNTPWFEFFSLNGMRFRRPHSSRNPAGAALRCAVPSERRAAGPPWRWRSGTRRAGGTATRPPAPGGPRSGAGSSGPGRSRTRSPLHGQRQSV